MQNTNKQTEIIECGGLGITPRGVVLAMHMIPCWHGLLRRAPAVQTKQSPSPHGNLFDNARLIGWTFFRSVLSVREQASVLTAVRMRRTQQAKRAQRRPTSIAMVS